MILRSVKPSDIIPINTIWEESGREFGIPSFADVIEDALAEQDGKIVGYGCLARFAEAMIWLDRKLPKKSLAKAINFMVTKAILACQARNVKQLHIFVHDSAFGEMLKKHYGFIPRSGEYLVLNLEK